MRIYEIKNESNEVFAFEISNTFLSRKKVVRLIKKLPGASVIFEPKAFSFSRDDEFCAFEYAGGTYTIWEPWGDNSRYWIGPKSGKHPSSIEQVMEFFRSA